MKTIILLQHKKTIFILSFFFLIIYGFIYTFNQIEEKNINKSVDLRVKYKFKVAYLEDERFPSLTKEQLNESLAFAKEAINDEFGIKNIDFEPIETLKVEQYFKKVLKYVYVSTGSFDPFEKKEAVYHYPQIEFFKRYDLDTLLKFIPQNERKNITTKNEFYSYLYDEWWRKSKHFTDLKINGKNVFTKESIKYQLYTSWEKLIYKQKDYDIIFTNSLIFYDNTDEPYPHVIFKDAKIGGFGKPCKFAPSGLGMATLVSTISFSGIEPFSEKDIPKEDIPKVMGYYLIAHEFGHMALDLPDVYDHELHCLMNTPPENFGYKKAADIFATHKGSCPKCKANLIRGKQRILDEKLY